MNDRKNSKLIELEDLYNYINKGYGAISFPKSRYIHNTLYSANSIIPLSKAEYMELDGKVFLVYYLAAKKELCGTLIIDSIFKINVDNYVINGYSGVLFKFIINRNLIRKERLKSI